MLPVIRKGDLILILFALNAQTPAQAGVCGVAVPEGAGRYVLVQRSECGIEGRARAHDLAGQLRVGAVVTADVHGLALHGAEFGNDGCFILGQGFGQWRELRFQLGIIVLCGKLLSPIQGQVEMAATVVQLAGFARWRLVVVQQLAGGRVEGGAQQFGFRVVGLDPGFFQGNR